MRLGHLVLTMDLLGTPVRGATYASRRRRLEAVMALLVAVVLLLSGCIDTVFPQAEREDDTPRDGQLRFFAATKPGGIGNEFVHYNITFGQVGHARDLFLEDLILMQPRQTTVDLVKLESERKAALVAVDTIRDGEYSGFGFFISRASVATERIVGNEAGRAITKIEEHVIEFSDSHVTPRAPHVVFGGRTTDIFLEIDLQRSFHRLEGGGYKHITIPAGVSVYVDGTKVHEYRMDGGESRQEADELQNPDRAKGDAPSTAPETSLLIKDPTTDARYYFDVIQKNKRMNRAMGLTEDLLFDASDSWSHYLEFDPDTQITSRVPIIEHKWDFGDGTKATGSRIIKNYTEGGLFDVVLQIRDAHDLVSQDHATIFVPYTAEQKEASRSADASGTIPIASTINLLDPDLSEEKHTFRFPPNEENGTLRLGGYRVELHPQNPLENPLGDLQEIRLGFSSGQFRGDVTGPGPFVLESAGIPVWREPLKPWVDTELTIEVELVTGLAIDYELHVEAHYYYNLSRGLDPHDGHIHAAWPFGPDWRPLHWDGTPARDD